MNFKNLQLFMDQITNWRIPGADIAIYFKNEPVFRYNSGYADIKSQKRISDDNLYFMYSATKVITCTAALQLFEKGKFLMSDPVSDYLPEFKEMHIKRDNELCKAENSIKIQDLFTMSAGFTYDLNSPSIKKAKQETQNICPTREIIKAIANEPLLFEPGTHWIYSLCHDVLGGLIEVISGMKFGDYLKENIFKPLGMNDTGFVITEEKEKRMAMQYNFNDITNTAAEISLSNIFKLGSEYESGGAGLISSVNDYIKFANAMCNNGIGKNGAHILSSHTIDLMRTNHLTEVSLKDFNWTQMIGYGYGLGVRTMIDRAKGGSLSPIGEFGWGGAAGAYVMIDPSIQLAVFYAQHLLNNQEPFVHPRLRNLVYSSLDS